MELYNIKVKNIDDAKKKYGEFLDKKISTKFDKRKQSRASPPKILQIMLDIIWLQV